MQDKVKEYALQHGFKETELLGQWEGFDVYSLFDSDDDRMSIGPSRYLLTQNGNIVEFVKDYKKIGEISLFFNYLNNGEIDTIDVTPKDLSPEEFAKRNGCTNIRLLGRLYGHDVYSIYSPTDEWIEKGESCFLLVKNDIVVKEVTYPPSIEGIINYWFENEYKEGETPPEDIRVLPKKMYSLEEMSKIADDHEIRPHTYEEMNRFMRAYEGVFGDQLGTWELGGKPEYVCFVIEYCIKTGIPLDETPPNGVIF